MELAEITVKIDKSRSSTNQSRSVYNNSLRRKVLWIIIVTIGIALVIAITTVILKRRKTVHHTYPSTIKITTNEVTTALKELTTESVISYTVKNNKSNQWKQEGIVVAEGDRFGDQLKIPHGIFMNENKSIFIADNGNCRVMEWKYESNSGEIVAGGDDCSELIDPKDIIYDEENHSLIVTDRTDKKVTRWFNKTRQILLTNIACWGLAIDRNGSIYSSDVEKHHVIRWREGENQTTIVAGRNGKGDELYQFDFPTHIFIHDDYSIYVSDYFNVRIMKWEKDSNVGIIVAGGNGNGNGLNQLAGPLGLTVDHFGYIYIADSFNNRIVRWHEGDSQGSIIIGIEEKLELLNHPIDLTFDIEGNLYVVDSERDRVVKFEKYS